MLLMKNRYHIMPSAQLLACQPIPVVRIALIGLGNRGMKTLERYQYIKHAEICCLVDIDKQCLDAANAKLTATGRPLARAMQGAEAWKEACQLADIDLVYICTEWRWHTVIAVEAMNCGKHVAVEVPAATSVAECWQLVETAERTRRHLFMTENCCYDLFALETLEMARQGHFGHITHCEGAYIHHIKSPQPTGCYHSDTQRNWMVHSCAAHGGNPYPTHAIGPIAQLLDFHHADRMVSLVSVTAKGAFEGDETDVMGRINTALIQTHNGVSIMLQLDVTTPRPYNRLQTVCGTKAFVQKYPLPTLQRAEGEPLTGAEALDAMQRYATQPAALLWQEGHALGVPNEMNYAMDARLIYCLNNGLPLDMDVYDAAEWSCLAELTQKSAIHGGMPVEIPDFRNHK